MIYVSLYYFSFENKEQIEFKIAIFVILIISNIYFLLIWGKHYYLNIFLIKYRNFKQKLLKAL